MRSDAWGLRHSVHLERETITDTGPHSSASELDRETIIAPAKARRDINNLQLYEEEEVQLMQVFFGTVVRGAPISAGGELVRLDWERKKIVARVPIYPSNPSTDNDPNTRGNTRGCKGITFGNNAIIAANYHTLQSYDLNLKLQWEITHGLMVGIHELYCTNNGKIWISSTAIDAALEYDLETGETTQGFWPRELESFQSALGLSPEGIDKHADNRLRYLDPSLVKNPSHLHLNAIASWRDEIYALFNRFGVIANLSAQEVVVKDPVLIGAHNLIICKNGTAIVNSTDTASVRFYSLGRRRLIGEIWLMDFRWVRSLVRTARMVEIVKHPRHAIRRSRRSMARPLFVRGLDKIGDLIFVGISPASILCIDWKKGVLIDAYTYSRDVFVSVHGLRVRTSREIGLLGKIWTVCW